MNDKQYQDLLEQLNACSEARRDAKGKSLTEVWSTCKRGDWMLWIAIRLQVPHTMLVLAVDAITKARRWTSGTEPSFEQAEIEVAEAVWAATRAARAAAKETRSASRKIRSAARVASLVHSADLLRTIIPLNVIEAAAEKMTKG